LVTQKLGQARSGAQFPGQGVLPARPIERLPKVFLGRCHRPVTILQQQLTFDAANTRMPGSFNSITLH
jgi:hypothetical protein